ncbi:MAG: isochorismatase family protein [Bacteroidaceae bacterium]|nr:isochorismatase family protein [Bacteroidaceae bacterium]
MDILVVVDLQKDFIDGKLAIPNGNAVVQPINNIKFRFNQVWFTLDWHPANHCSFKEQGGIWPVHCLHYSMGASVPDCIMEGLESQDIRFIQKAENPDIEEYGAFTHTAPEEGLFSKDDNLVVCGIASEYCVLETLRNLVRLRDAIGFKVSVFMNGCGCFETQQPLLDFMSQNNVPEYNAL